MKIFITIFTILFIIGMRTAEAQEQSTHQNGKFSGLMFGDLFYNIDANNAALKNFNGFQFRRIDITYDYTISPEFITRLRVEDDQSALSSNHKILFFAKDFWLQWKEVFGGSDLTMGLSPTPAYDVSEAAWGYRALEKTIMDLHGIVPSRDIGVDLKGTLAGNGVVHYWLKAGNNSNTSPETDKFKRYYGLIQFKPVTEFQATAYADFESAKDTLDNVTHQYVNNSRVTVAGFANYAVNNSSSLGVEGFYKMYQDNYRASTGQPLQNMNSLGITGFAWFTVTDRWRLIGRVDYYDPNTSADGDGTMLFIVSADYMPVPDVHFMPNIYFIAYQAANSTTDVTARISFWYNFH